MPRVPASIAKAAEEYGLGEVEERFRLSVLYETATILTCAPIGVLGLAIGDHVGRAIGAAFLVLASIVSVFAWRKYHRHLYLCSGGLLTTRHGTRPRGTRPRGTRRRGTVVTAVLAWDQIAHVRAWTTRLYKPDGVESFYRCKLELTDGRRLNLAAPPYVDGERLAEVVRRRVAAVLYPRVAAQLAEQGAVGFGPIVLTADGLRDGARSADWPDISKVAVGRVRLRVWTSARPPVISRQVRKVPDITVLLALVNERLRDAAPARG